MSSTIDHLDGLIPEDVGNEVLRLVEDPWFDRKSIRIDAQKLAKSLVALANAEGGVIVVGVHDGGVEGTDAKSSAFQPSPMRQPSRRARPPARTHRRHQRRRPHNQRDECYLRVGDGDRKLRFEQRQELT